MAKFDRLFDPSPLSDGGDLDREDCFDEMNFIWDKVFSGANGNILTSFYPESMEKVLKRLGYEIKEVHIAPSKELPKETIVIAIKPGEEIPTDYIEAMEVYSVGEVIGREFQKVLIEAFVWAHNHFVRKNDAEN